MSFCLARHKRKGQLALSLVDLAIAFSVVSFLFALDGHAGEPIIGIDVGHSQASPGATSARGVPEHLFNRELSQALEKKLASSGFRTLLIGADGKLTDLTERTARARVGKATFLLSVHHDSVQPRYLKVWRPNGSPELYSDRFSGYSLFVSRGNVEAGTSLRCASAIGAAFRRQGFRPSAHHAEAIPGEGREWADEENGVYYYNDLAVLRNAASPAVLLEAGIIVNPKEEQSVRSERVRAMIVSSIEEALTACGMLK